MISIEQYNDHIDRDAETRSEEILTTRNVAHAKALIDAIARHATEKVQIVSGSLHPAIYRDAMNLLAEKTVISVEVIVTDVLEIGWDVPKSDNIKYRFLDAHDDSMYHFIVADDKLFRFELTSCDEEIQEGSNLGQYEIEGIGSFGRPEYAIILRRRFQELYAIAKELAIVDR